MNRVIVLTISAAFLAGISISSPAMAADSPDPFSFISTDAPGFEEYQVLIERLDQDGALILLIQKTWLGRLRVVSTLNGKVREVVISPNTGEIRRDIIVGDYNPSDYADGNKGKSASARGAGNSNRGGNSGSHGGGGSQGRGR